MWVITFNQFGKWRIVISIQRWWLRCPRFSHNLLSMIPEKQNIPVEGIPPEVPLMEAGAGPGVLIGQCFMGYPSWLGQALGGRDGGGGRRSHFIMSEGFQCIAGKGPLWTDMKTSLSCNFCTEIWEKFVVCWIFPRSIPLSNQLVNGHPLLILIQQLGLL